MMLPRMARVRQHFDTPVLQDIPAAVREEVAKLGLAHRVRPGDSVAIPVGSRGIANIALIVKSLVDVFKEMGAEPFLVPAMGSHGGGTAEGQRQIIESYGVTEAYTGAPIRASMDTVQVGTTAEGIPVHFDKFAYAADHVAVVGRVKPHTSFVGEIESGLHKMMMIGLGKRQGATLSHQAIVNYDFGHIIRSVCPIILAQCNILFGLGIVENAYDQTALLKGVRPGDFYEEEKALLKLARQWMPRLPFDAIDLLIVDEMGKNISGTGLDTNVVGRKYYDGKAAPDERPRITRIAVRDLTEKTHGNATGIGIADYVHRRVVEKMDRQVTAINSMTGNHPSAAAVPIHFDTDGQMLSAALQTVGFVEPERAGVVRIHNTLDLGEILISEAFMPQVEGRDDLAVVEPPRPMPFDDHDDLLPF